MKQFLKPSLLSLALFSSYASANIPEPDVVFYGKITSQVGATQVSLTEGNLNWVIRPKEGEGKSFTFTTPLESLSDGQYSYKISIPQEYLVAVETLESEQSNMMTVEAAKDLLLHHYQITVNGQPALLVDDKLAFFAVSEENRSNHLQVDLIVSEKALGSLGDANENGLPDVWESHYGLTSGGQDDPDGDGWSNEEEYANGSDPNVNNKLPQLSGESGAGESIEVRLYENGLSQLRLKVLDSDSDLSDIVVSIDQLPDGVALYHVDDLSQSLQVEDSILASDLQSGNIFSRYSPELLLDSNGLAVDPSSLELTLFDNGPLHYPATEADEESEAAEVTNEGVTQTVKLSVFRPSNVADPVRWIDGAPYKGQSVEMLKGRSGQALDTILTYTHDGSLFSPTGASISVSDEGLIEEDPDWGMFAFAEPDDPEQRTDLSGSRSIFAAYQPADAAYENIFFNDGNIHWSDMFAYASFGETSSDARIKSTQTHDQGVNIASIHTASYLSHFELNGKPAGGPKPHSGETIEASSLAGFGFALGSFGTNAGQVWPFEGGVGEFIAYPGVLEGTDKWLINAYLLSKWRGFTVFDASKATTPSSLNVTAGIDSPTLLLGGVGDDELVASGSESILVGGAGEDVLVGGDGADHFVVGDGDTVKNFTEYESLLVQDVLDISELLDVSDVVLEKCVYFKPVENNTLVKINSACLGEDQVSGTDFTDAQFTIEGQGLWNSDVPVLWRSGALYAGNHKPGHIAAALHVAGGQTFSVNENEGVGDSTFKVFLEYSGGQPYEGQNLQLPLVISGSAEPVTDFDLTLKRFIDSADDSLLSDITDGEYDYSELLYDLSDEELSSYGLEKVTNEYDEVALYQHYNVLETYQSAEVPVYVPSQLTEDRPESKRLEFTVHVKKDGLKEEDESIQISLQSVPEYYDLVPEKGQVEVSITDGLDKVSVSVVQSIIYEGKSSEVTLHREGAIDSPLTVTIGLSGLASNGDDYAVVSSQATFAKGETTTVIPITALSDNLSEQIEQIELKVLASPLYEVVPTQNLVELYIHDEALNFVDTDKDGLPDSWELAMGLSPSVSNQLGDGYRDSDQDGLSDEEEYRLGTNPMKADSDGDDVPDGTDADPNDADVKSIDELKGYQTVLVGHDSAVNVPLGMNRIINIPLEYLTSDGSDQVSGLQLILQYNADQLEYLGVDQVLPKSHASTGGPTPKEVYRGGYKLYTHQVPVSWDASGGDWPSMPLPAKLLSARFKVVASTTVGQQFMIGVDAQSAAEGYAFKPTQMLVNVVAPGVMDILANEQDSADEGVILARHLAGLSPELPEVDAESKLTADEVVRIRQHIQEAGLQYDVDGDGVVNPLSDAVLIYHYLRDDGLTDSQVQTVLGTDTLVKAVDVEARIREIQEGAR